MTPPTCSALLASTLLLVSCASPAPQRLPVLSGPQAAGTTSRADATVACRAEVDRVYAAQNRADLSTRDDRDSPFAANYLPGVTTQGLGARYGRDNQLKGCLANASGGGGGSGAAITGSNPGPTFNPTVR